MGRLRLFGAAMALALGVLSFGLGPAAAENPGKPAPPGQEKTPPGQAAKAESSNEAGEKGKPETVAPPGQVNKETAEPAPAADPPAQADNGESASRAEAPSSQSKPKHDAAPKADKATDEQPAKPAKAAKPAKSEAQRGNSSVAHIHVIICHRTGSTKNPYVVINISKSAWLEGHTTHPALNGHSDILLKEGAAPGEKMARSACGSSEGPIVPTPPTVDVLPKPKPDPKQDPKSDPKADKPGDPSVPSTPASTPAVIPSATPVRPAGSASVEGVAVAGDVEVLAVDELPFTGMPLWLAVFGGCLLLGTGLAIRKASWAPEGDAQGAPVSTSSKKADTISR